MIFQGKSRKRRSDRLRFRIPLRVEGITEKGDAFECQGHTTALNRHGAQIRLHKPVAVGRQVRLTNLDNGATGSFRVVGILASSSANGTEFGVEALGNYPAFWGIDFPSRPKKPPESRALLECRRCRATRLLPLSLSEVDVLESGGVLLKPCAVCEADTRWGYALEAAGVKEFPQGPPRAGPDPEGLPNALTQPEERGGRPAFVQRPISIRTSSGQVDKAQTESLWKWGLSYSSEKTYQVNQEVTLEWANPGAGLRVEVQGRFLRRLDVGGSRRKIYNIHYESPVTALPAAHSGETRKRYLAFGALVAAAAVLVETNVMTLASGAWIPDESADRVAYFGGVLLLLSLAYKVWKSILEREPEAQKNLKTKHRIVTGLVAVLLTGALALGVARGLYRGFERVHAQRLLRDLAISATLEKNVDAAENRVFAAPDDYVDACATLQLLAGQWETQLDNLSGDAQALTGSQWRRGGKFERAMRRFRQIIRLNHQKIELVQKQVNLGSQARNIPSDRQEAFWQANFQPLRRQILELNARKRRLLRSPLVEN